MPESDLVALAITIRSRREAMGVAQETFAYERGFDRGAVGAVERGHRNIGIVLLRRFVTALDLSWAAFGAALMAAEIE